MQKLVTRFIKDESGATAIEYGLIAALVAVACIAALSAMSGEMQGGFNTVATEIGNATP